MDKEVKTHKGYRPVDDIITDLLDRISGHRKENGSLPDKLIVNKDEVSRIAMYFLSASRIQAVDDYGKGFEDQDLLEMHQTGKIPEHRIIYVRGVRLKTADA